MNCDRYIKEESHNAIYMRTRLLHLQTTGRTVKRIPKYGIFLGDTLGYSIGVTVDAKLKTKVNGILQQYTEASHYKPTIQETNDLADLGFTQFTALMDLTEDEINQVLTAPGDHKTKQRLRTKIKQIRSEVESVKALDLFDQGVPLCKLANWQWKVLDDIAKDRWKNVDAKSAEENAKDIARRIGKREHMGGACNRVYCRHDKHSYEERENRKLIKQNRVNLYSDRDEELEGIHDAALELLEEYELEEDENASRAADEEEYDFIHDSDMLKTTD